MLDYGSRMTDRALMRTEARMRAVYRRAKEDIDETLKAFEKRHTAADRRYRAMMKMGAISEAEYASWLRGQVFIGQRWKERKEAIEQVLYNADKTALQIINNDRVEAFTANANYMGYTLETGERMNINFALYDENTVKRLLRDNPQMLPKSKVKKSKAFPWYNRLVNNAVTQGIIAGDSIDKIAKRIGEFTGERAQSAMMRNARTAFTAAQNAGRIEGMHQAQRLGVNVQKRWMSTLDARTRDAHQDLDGQIQEVDKPFKSELGDIMYPGDPTAKPGNIYNCRCTLGYAYPDYQMNIQRRDNETGKIIGDMTYREWEKWKKRFTKREESSIINKSKSGGLFMMNLQLFAEKDIKKQTIQSLKRGIRSYNEAIEEHKDKIANPETYYDDWDVVSDKVRRGRIKHWEKEIRNFERSIAEREDELKRRGAL